MTPEDQWDLQKEKGLAWLRAGFALIAVLVIQLNPSRVARFPWLSYSSLVLFLLYSVGILYLTQREKTNFRKIAIVTTALDLVWVSAIVFSTGGSRTPFFIYYLFPAITAGSRYGIKGGLAVSLVGATLYGLIRFDFPWERPLGVDVFLVRTVYLIVFAYIFGFLSEFETKQNRKLLALSRTAAQVAALEERRRIMREIHDGLLQSLATHILRLEMCRRHFVDSPRELETELRSIEEETRSAMKLIREFLAGKETHAFPPGMILEKLKGDLQFMRDGLGLQVILETQPDDISLPETIEQDVYYVLREALANIARHAHASRAVITLEQNKHDVAVALRDDGVGFDLNSVKNGRGFGLTSMEERIKKHGGTLRHQSAAGKGTTISFRVPIRA
jgi:signal transduction histidine kinase